MYDIWTDSCTRSCDEGVPVTGDDGWRMALHYWYVRVKPTYGLEIAKKVKGEGNS